MKSKPLVSVLMPMYNVEAFISEAVESILSQDFSYFELIIVDDGSSDGSLRKVQEYALSDQRIRLYSQKNKGITYTRNKLISLADGDYLAWMDSDDISHPKRLGIQYEYLEKYKDIFAVGTWAMLVDVDNNDLCRWETPLRHDNIDRRHIKGIGGAVVFSSVMMRHTGVLSLGGFDESLKGAEDLDFFLRLAEDGRLANIDEVLFRYRQHLNSISYDSRVQIQEDSVKVVKLALGRRGLAMQEIKTDLSAEATEHEIYHKWAWWALRDGNVWVARKYAFKALSKKPLYFAYWKSLLCACRGY